MVIVKATAGSESRAPSTPDLRAAMNAYNEELSRAGILLAAEGLRPSIDGARVQVAGAERGVTRGPFANPEELIAGYWLWRVDSLDDAIAWAQRCPPPHPDGGVLEIRPVYEPRDVAAIRAREAGKDVTDSQADPPVSR